MAFFISCPSFFMLALAVVAIMGRWFAVPQDRRRTEFLLAVTVLMEPLAMISEAAANAMSSIRPLKYDAYLFHFDSIFGSPSFRIGQLVFAHTWMIVTLALVYGLLPVATVAAFALCLYRDSEAEAAVFVRALIVMILAGVPIYLLFPASGPVYAFPSFPALPHAVPLQPLALSAPPNAVPSGHCAAALVIFWFLRKWGWGRIAGGVFLALTVLATLGSGQHYLFDLLAAVPFTAFALRVAKASSKIGRTIVSPAHAAEV